jgi:hypothetical protein
MRPAAAEEDTNSCSPVRANLQQQEIISEMHGDIVADFENNAISINCHVT